MEVTVEELQSQTRKENVTAYRRGAMARMDEEGDGPTEIGKFFNRTKGAFSHA